MAPNFIIKPVLVFSSCLSLWSVWSDNFPKKCNFPPFFSKSGLFFQQGNIGVRPIFLSDSTKNTQKPQYFDSFRSIQNLFLNLANHLGTGEGHSKFHLDGFSSYRRQSDGSPWWRRIGVFASDEGICKSAQERRRYRCFQKLRRGVRRSGYGRSF